MARGFATGLRQLDQCLSDRESLDFLRTILNKIEKCCSAIDKNVNLADILHDEANYQSILKLFGEDGIEVGVQLILKVALNDYLVRSFSLRSGIGEKKKIDFLYRSIGGWQQFDSILSFLLPDANQRVEGSRSFALLNPQRKAHWEGIESIPPGTLVTLFVKTKTGKRSIMQEELAIDRFKAVVELMQSKAPFEDSIAPVIPIQAAKNIAQTVSKKTSVNHYPRFSSNKSTAGGKLSLSFEVVISKVDTFIHAGNAQLIIGHLSNYPGRVEMFVLRGQKAPVQLDADSIWGKEIRNGETVLYEFYGPKPSDEFVKELFVSTNKYTQMDKISNE